MGRKGFVPLTLPHHSPSLKEVRTGTQTGQEPGGSRCRGHGGVLACSACSLTELKTTIPASLLCPVLCQACKAPQVAPCCCQSHHPSPPPTAVHIHHPGCFSLAESPLAPSAQPEAREVLEGRKHNHLLTRCTSQKADVEPSGGEGSPSDVSSPGSRGLKARTVRRAYSSKPLQDRDDYGLQRQRLMAWRCVSPTFRQPGRM